MSRTNTKARRNEFAYNAYRVTSPGHETRIVFASGIWSAVGVLLRWREANGIGQVGFHLDPAWAAGLEGVARQHIDEARALCREPRMGTRYRADVGWGLMTPLFKGEPAN